MKKTISVILCIVIVCTVMTTACSRNDETAKTPYDIKLNYNQQAEMGLHYRIIDGGVYARGVDTFGIFGESHEIYDEWFEVAKHNNAIHIDAFSGTVVYLTSDGNVYGFGNSESGVLQTNPNQNGQWEEIRKPLLLFEECKYASVGVGCMLFLKNDNTLWFVGESKNGQSTEIKDIIYEPVKIADNVLFAEALSFTSAWIDSEYNLYLCGDNSCGQLGNGIMGCGFPTMFKDVYPEPYCALKNCISFSTEYEGDVWSVWAETANGDKYVWGGEYGPSPVLISN